MKIGIGLPNAFPGLAGRAVLDWARRAEQRGFHGLATIDRIAYPSYDTLATLAAVAGATSKIALLSNIILAPLHPPVLLAKSAASIDQLSGGRLTLGVAAGARADDFAAVGRDFHRRGRDLDAALDLMHRAWRGQPVGDGGSSAVCPTPTRDNAVPILVGGSSDAAIRRVATWGVGWSDGGGGPDRARQIMQRIRSAWRSAGRPGEPRLVAIAYYSLGDDLADESRAYLRSYYGYLGGVADRIAEQALRTPAAIRDTVTAFTDIGCAELYLDPTCPGPDQVDRLADVVL